MKNQKVNTKNQKVETVVETVIEINEIKKEYSILLMEDVPTIEQAKRMQELEKLIKSARQEQQKTAVCEKKVEQVETGFTLLKKEIHLLNDILQNTKQPVELENVVAWCGELITINKNVRNELPRKTTGANGTPERDWTGYSENRKRKEFIAMHELNELESDISSGGKSAQETYNQYLKAAKVCIEKQANEKTPSALELRAFNLVTELQIEI